VLRNSVTAAGHSRRMDPHCITCDRMRCRGGHPPASNPFAWDDASTGLLVDLHHELVRGAQDQGGDARFILDVLLLEATREVSDRFSGRAVGSAMELYFYWAWTPFLSAACWQVRWRR
jgi:hypothetical protein